MDITADADMLLRQASMTAHDYLWDAVDLIDKQFGDGFAKKNPALVAEMVRAQSADFNTAILKIAAQDVRDGL